MKKIYLRFLSIFVLSILLVACSKPPVPAVQEENISQVAPTKQTLSNDATEQYYRTIIPYVSSPTRGLVYSYLANKYDIEEMELSLMRYSQSYFNTNEVYFQEGQYLTKPVVKQMLAKKKTQAELEQALAEDDEYVDLGLNPSTDETIEINGLTINPVYLSYLLEQDYVVLEGDQTTLKGVSIGLALNPYQTWKNEELGYTQTVVLEEEELIAKGKEIAQHAIDILRTQEGFENVDIMVGLYVLQEQSAVVPGRMVAKTLVSSGSSKIKNWDSVNEQYYLLPDSKIQEIDYELSEQFVKFKDTIKEYYPHYYGVIGVAHYVDNKLDNLEITVNIDFYGLAEKLSFHQLLAQLMNETFSNYYDITVVVRSTEEIFGILTRNANEKDIDVNLINWE